MPCIKVEKDGEKYFIELPLSELQVLQALAPAPQGLIVPNITKALKALRGLSFDPRMYDAVTASLIRRLREKRLVVREEVKFPVTDTTTTKRVIWKKNFDNMEVLPTVERLPD